MKKNILWIVAAIVLLAGCLDDDNNYDYRQVNGLDGYKVENVKQRYDCFQGEELELEPKIKFSIDSITPDASYEWYVDGVLKSTEPTYHFVAERPGRVEIVFCSIDNKTGLKFPHTITIEVASKYLKGWTILSEEVGGRSVLSMVMMKIEQWKKMENGQEVEYDTIIYTGQEVDILPNLGSGPIRLRENFTFDINGIFEGQLPDELVVVQKNKCVELNGNTFDVMAYAEDEFIGSAPAGFEPQDAVGNYACKYVLNKDGYLYFAQNAVSLDLHTARYLPDPAFGGKKVQAIVSAHKVDYGQSFGLMWDEDNTLFGIINNVSPNEKNGYSNGTMEDVGKLAEVSTGSGTDKSLFENYPGEILYTEVETYDSEEPSFLSLLKEDGKYYAHVFGLYYYRRPPITVESSVKRELDPGMFTQYKEAVVFPYKDFVIVANGNELWHCAYTHSGDRGKRIKTFDKPIVGINCKDFNRDDLNAHLGIALEGGEFYIYELGYPESGNVNEVDMRQLYYGTGFGKVVDVLYKFGRSHNITAYNGIY